MPELAVTLWVAVISGFTAIASTVIIVWRMYRGRNGSDEVLGAPWLLRASLPFLVLSVVTGLIAIYALILYFAFHAEDFKLPEKANIPSPIIVAATLIAGTLTAVFAVLKVRVHLLAEAKGKLEANGEVRAGEKHRNDQEAAYSERFAEASRLLAEERTISRIAGAHLVLAIGDEWKSPGAQQRCFDVLLSHLRWLNLDESFDDDSNSRDRREEVRLITSELFKRLGDEDAAAWGILTGDFSGAVLSELDPGKLKGLARLDLSDARVLGDLSIQAGMCVSTPRLSGLTCYGNLSIESGHSWDEEGGSPLDLSNSEVKGSVSIVGVTANSVLSHNLIASGISVGGDLRLEFDSFLGDVTLDSAVISGLLVIGHSDHGAFYGTAIESGEVRERKPTKVSAVGATFGEFRLRHSEQGPRLDLTEAVGKVDLRGSVFHFEVTAINLDASNGLQLRDAAFESLLVLEGALTPDSVDLDGVKFSKQAKEAFRASSFELREAFLVHDEAHKVERPFEHEVLFDWNTAIDPYLGQCSPSFVEDLASRLSALESSLPVDWNLRRSFTAEVMNAVSRAATRSDISQELVAELQRSLRDSLRLASN